MLQRRWFLVAALLSAAAWAQQPDPPGQVAKGEAPVNEAYLFAHMTHHGHPDIARGPDGTYYIAGNESDASPTINVWSSRI